MTNIEIKLKQISDFTTEANIRDHKILIDRPETKGGTNNGAMGGELLLASLGGCFNSNLLAAIKTRKADISNIRLKVIGTLDGEPLVFKKIKVEVSADHQDRELLEKLVVISERACISSNTLKFSGVEVYFSVQ